MIPAAPPEPTPDAAIAAIHFNGGRLRGRVAPVKLVASAITIGSGGSGGREGPAAQISATFGSLLSGWLRLDPRNRRIAVAAGMGAGIGAIFRAPLGGAVMATEILYLHDLEAEAPLVDPDTRPMTVSEARAQGSLILVAEDDEINQKVILRQLELLGHAAEVAVDGQEALAMWRRGQYAMLITDMHMPEMDGYALTAAIRAEEDPTDRLPIVALSANALRGEELRAKVARRLADHEWYVATYYWDRDKPMGTVLRLRRLLERYRGVGYDERALWLLGRAYAKVDMADRARTAWTELVAKYPQSGEAGKAKGALAKLPATPAPAPTPTP